MIACTHGINFGMPSIKGRRITVYNVLTTAWYANDVGEELNDFNLTLYDLADAVYYCKNLKCKVDEDRLHYCDGCILRTFEEGWDFNKEDYLEIEIDGKPITFAKDGGLVSLGSLQELEDQELGEAGWLMAEEINKKLPGL